MILARNKVPLTNAARFAARNYVMAQDGATAQSHQWKEREQALEKAYIASKDTENLLKLKKSLEDSIQNINTHLISSSKNAKDDAILTSSLDKELQIKALEEQFDIISKRLASLEAGSRHI